jgi:hypothetical protein
MDTRQPQKPLVSPESLQQPQRRPESTPHSHTEDYQNTADADYDNRIQYDDDGTDDFGHDHGSDEDEDEDGVRTTAKAAAGWRGWYRSLLHLFRGLGKFFLILALGTIVLVLVLKYTLPSVDE